MTARLNSVDWCGELQLAKLLPPLPVLHVLGNMGAERWGTITVPMAGSCEHHQPRYLCTLTEQWRSRRLPRNNWWTP